MKIVLLHVRLHAAGKIAFESVNAIWIFTSLVQVILLCKFGLAAVIVVAWVGLRFHRSELSCIEGFGGYALNAFGLSGRLRDVTFIFVWLRRALKYGFYGHEVFKFLFELVVFSNLVVGCHCKLCNNAKKRLLTILHYRAFVLSLFQLVFAALCLQPRSPSLCTWTTFFNIHYTAPQRLFLDHLLLLSACNLWSGSRDAILVASRLHTSGTCSDSPGDLTDEWLHRLSEVDYPAQRGPFVVENGMAYFWCWLNMLRRSATWRRIALSGDWESACFKKKKS